MGMPVKLSDDLVRQARKEAKAADRSITAQIEHWAKLGRSVESALRHDDASALKETSGNLDQAFPRKSTRTAVLDVLRNVARGHDFRVPANRVVYQSAADGAIERITPDGHRTRGRFVNRQFVPEAESRSTRK
jgi:hypothetical protein